ncbi:MAG TPA: restriction endonuclease, partial [Candidatus Saccharimonadales bacterium]|nr:restriction endonuclease [Candidatus Saccharimonadales bacterium]
FEQYTDEDDYGNISIQEGFKQELIYFSEKVVLPALEDCIGSGKTVNKNVTLILADTLRVLEHMPAGVKYEEANEATASKLLSAIDGSPISDDVLYAVCTSSDAMDTYLNGATDIFMRTPSITLFFGDKLRVSQPMKVTPFVALVFMAFSVMHNSKSRTASKEHHATPAFTGNDPYKYEEFIKSLLRSRGFAAKRTRSSGDFGVDVVASKHGKTFAIQCKLYNKPVGTKAIQEIVSGRMFYKADFAVVVSDNSFTDAAKVLARRLGVILTHHNDLLHKIEKFIASEDETHDSNKPNVSVDSQESQKTATKKQWTQEDDDELITVVLPTITNDGK